MWRPYRENNRGKIAPLSLEKEGITFIIEFFLKIEANKFVLS